jgi:hypothetical protein
MKLMQQNSNQSQPPEKKLRVTGGYTNGDQSNYDYQVKTDLNFSLIFDFLF